MVSSLLSWPPFIFLLLVFYSQLDSGRARFNQVIKEVTQEIWVYGLSDNTYGSSLFQKNVGRSVSSFKLDMAYLDCVPFLGFGVYL